MPTKVLKCTCDHTYQDEKYGYQMRVHNQCKLGSDVGWRCTVCKKEKLK